MKAVFLTILWTNSRDRMIPALWAGVFCLLLLCKALGGAVLVEGHEAALAYGSLSLRLALVVGIILTVCFQIRRLDETRDLEMMVCRPVSAGGVVLALAAAYCLIAVAAVVPVALALAVILSPDPWGWGVWTVSLILECWVAVGFSLFLSLGLNSAAGAGLAALALYVLSRAASGLRDIAQAGLGDALQSSVTGVPLRLVAEGAALILPRLDLFGQSAWLIYGSRDGGRLGLLAAQAVLYLGLLLSAAWFDLKGRRFR